MWRNTKYPIEASKFDSRSSAKCQLLQYCFECQPVEEHVYHLALSPNKNHHQYRPYGELHHAQLKEKQKVSPYVALSALLSVFSHGKIPQNAQGSRKRHNWLAGICTKPYNASNRHTKQITKHYSKDDDAAGSHRYQHVFYQETS